MSTEPEPTPPQPDQQPFARAMDGNYLSCDYPEDAAHENGNYATKCQCGAAFIGHKRRVICKVCAESPEPDPPQHEPQQSAVEWVRSMIIPESDGPVDFSPEHLPSPKALELAQRCDEAEAQVKRYDGYHSALVTESCDLRAQLADAQAGYNTYGAKCKELQDQLAASQAEAAEMRKQRDLAGKQVLTLTTEINRLRKGITEIKAGTRIGWFMVDLGVKCSKLLNE